MQEYSTEQLTSGVLSGNIRAIARSISLIENEAPSALQILSALYMHVGKAYRAGITGPPGAGKSTLVNKLALAIRKDEHKIGILAVDPSSPFTGGAILGDRIRMYDSVQDPGVYMRSMATRGNLGGLARTTSQAADLLDASGRDYILIETVGVGQIELDVAEAADTTVVVLVPESGGSIQAMKAGIMEIADILVINKADRPGAEELEEEILQIMEMKPPCDYRVPILRVSAKKGEGIDALYDALKAHRAYLASCSSTEEKRRAQIQCRITGLVLDRIRACLSENAGLRDLVKKLSSEVCDHRSDPFSAAREILQRLCSRDIFR